MQLWDRSIRACQLLQPVTEIHSHRILMGSAATYMPVQTRLTAAADHMYVQSSWLSYTIQQGLPSYI